MSEKVPPRTRQPHRLRQHKETKHERTILEGLELSKREQLEQFRADKNQWLSQWRPFLSANDSSAARCTKAHAYKARLAAVVHSITMLFILLAVQPPPR
jgi:hypothetical protein